MDVAAGTFGCSKKRRKLWMDLFSSMTGCKLNNEHVSLAASNRNVPYKKKQWKPPIKMKRIRRKYPHMPKPEEQGGMP
jgi:hypothetical protein